MRNCFILAGVVFLQIGITEHCLAGEAVLNATSVVSADPGSGRLVRKTVVSANRPDGARVSAGALEKVFRESARIDDLVEEAAKKYDVDPLLIHSMIKVESDYNPFAISPAGAEGLMQLIPTTARRIGVDNAFNPKQNIDGGVRHIKYLQEIFKDDHLALAAYNAGEAAVTKYKRIPPYPETQQYVNRVGAKYGELKKKANAEYGMASPKGEEIPRYRPLEMFIDSEGKVHLRTK